MGLLQSRPALGFGHMEVRVDTEAQEISDQITYLYKYVYLFNMECEALIILSFREGRSTSSFGTW